MTLIILIISFIATITVIQTYYLLKIRYNIWMVHNYVKEYWADTERQEIVWTDEEINFVSESEVKNGNIQDQI